MRFKIFNNEIVERAIAIILLVIGIAGTISEIEKLKMNDIKGMDDVFFGLIFTVPSFLGIIKTDIIWLHAILVLIFLFGMYGEIKGILEIIYSLKLVKRKSKNKKIEIMQIVVTLTEVIALVVAILQLVSEI